MGKIKACQRGWEYAQIFGEEGAVEICSWASMNYHPIGKLTENTMYDIWHGEDARKFRQSLIDGSYCYCEKEKCPWMANGTLEEHMKEYDDELEYPVDVSLSFQRACNYTCTCCADNENIRAKTKDAEKNLSQISGEIEKFIDNVEILSANGRGELFASKHIMDMLHNWKPSKSVEKIKVILETNGSLFNESNWKKIENLGNYDLKVAITVMSFEEKTYQFLSGTKLPVKNILDNLHFVKTLREKNIINDFEIGTVIQERNFREMPEFSKRCVEEFGVDRVRLRPYFPWGPADPIVKWVYDVRNPYHPYYVEYEEMLKADIFKHPKVFMWSGEELSNQGKNPYAKDKENFDVIKFLAADINISKKINKYFRDKGIEKVYIRGMGFVGQAFVNILNKTDVKILGLMDKNWPDGKCYEGHIIIDKECDLEKDTAIIVTTPFYFDEIKEEMSNILNDNEIINISDIISCIEG